MLLSPLRGLFVVFMPTEARLEVKFKVSYMQLIEGGDGK